MKWLVVLDPIVGLIAKTDTSLAFIKATRERGIEVDTATIEDLFFENSAGAWATDIGNTVHRRLLDEYHLILMRKEPPYDLSFHYAAQILSLTKTPVVNSPQSLRDYNEKLIALNFSKYMPKTLVSSSPEKIMQFVEQFSNAVIKSLDSFQGKSVQKISSSDKNIAEEFTNNGCKPVMVQEFVDTVYDGDKRVIMIGPHFAGAALRKPKQGYHANFANSEALKTELTPREKGAVEEIGPWLVSHGIHFAGLDFIGDYLTEINITCPTGIIQISELENRNVPDEAIDYFLQLIR